jgi:type IV secretion system protein TrbJ
MRSFNRRSRRALVAAGLAAALAAGGPRSANSLIVYCSNCSTETTQLLSWAKQLDQYVAQLQQVQAEISTLTNAIQNTVSLPQSLFNNISSTINSLTNISSGASLLSGNTGQFLTNLSNRTGYPLQNVANITQQLTAETNATANAIQAFGRMLNLQPGQLQSSSATLAALQSQAMNATGRQQVLQSLAGITAITGQQLQSSQALMTAALQAQLTVATSDADRRALQDAALQQMLNAPPLPVTGQVFKVGQ